MYLLFSYLDVSCGDLRELIGVLIPNKPTQATLAIAIKALLVVSLAVASSVLLIRMLVVEQTPCSQSLLRRRPHAASFLPIDP